MPDPRDKVDLSLNIVGGPGTGGFSNETRGEAAAGRPWLSLWFRCSNTYTRAYRNAAGTGYTGRCPKCGKSMRFMVGPGGTGQRTFEVSC